MLGVRTTNAIRSTVVLRHQHSSANESKAFAHLYASYCTERLRTRSRQSSGGNPNFTTLARHRPVQDAKTFDIRLSQSYPANESPEAARRPLEKPKSFRSECSESGAQGSDLAEPVGQRVELIGIEPTTSGLQSPRSPS